MCFEIPFWLEVFRLQAGTLCNPREHFGADLIAIVEGPREFIMVAVMFKLLVRAALANAGLFPPANSQQCTEDLGRPG
jgi:hypothetical protein